MPVRILDEEPTLARPVSQLCTESQWRAPAYAHWCRHIREDPRYHRKQWEFCYALQALSEAGALAPERRGLGFGVGREPLCAVFASLGCQITATDQDPTAAQGWADTGQYSQSLEALNERGICAPDLFGSRVKFETADMNRIPEHLREFDFVWSCCALEHLGSLEHGLAFVRNSLDCLVPGGVAVHTTEFNVSSDTDTLFEGPVVLFRRSEIVELAEGLVSDGHSIVLNFNSGSGPLDVHVDLPPYAASPHLKLLLDRFVTTSIGLIVRKAGG